MDSNVFIERKIRKDRREISNHQQEIPRQQEMSK